MQQDNPTKQGFFGAVLIVVLCGCLLELATIESVLHLTHPLALRTPKHSNLNFNYYRSIAFTFFVRSRTFTWALLHQLLLCTLGCGNSMVFMSSFPARLLLGMKHIATVPVMAVVSLKRSLVPLLSVRWGLEVAFFP